MIWTTLILAGLVTFFTRFSMIALLKKDYFSPRVKIVLSYIPSAVFPAIIFPAIFLNSTGQQAITVLKILLRGYSQIIFLIDCSFKVSEKPLKFTIDACVK